MRDHRGHRVPIDDRDVTPDREDVLEEWPEERIQSDLVERKRARVTVSPGVEVDG